MGLIHTLWGRPRSLWPNAIIETHATRGLRNGSIFFPSMMLFGDALSWASARRFAPSTWIRPERFNNTNWKLPRSGSNLFSCRGAPDESETCLHHPSSAVVSHAHFDVLVESQMGLFPIHCKRAEQYRCCLLCCAHIDADSRLATGA